MKLLRIVTWTFEINKDYCVDIVINNGILESWIYKKDVPIKSFIVGMNIKDTSYDEYLKTVENYIEKENLIQYYESEYIDI